MEVAAVEHRPHCVQLHCVDPRLGLDRVKHSEHARAWLAIANLAARGTSAKALAGYQFCCREQQMLA